jgi:hypothetical protein
MLLISSKDFVKIPQTHPWFRLKRSKMAQEVPRLMPLMCLRMAIETCHLPWGTSIQGFNNCMNMASIEILDLQVCLLDHSIIKQVPRFVPRYQRQNNSGIPTGLLFSPFFVMELGFYNENYIGLLDLYHFTKVIDCPKVPKPSAVPA